MLTVLPTAAAHRRGGYLNAVDPRARIVVAVALSIAVVAAGRLATVGLALAVAAAATIANGVPLRVAAKRLLPLNALMLLLVLTLPLCTPGTVLWQFGPLGFSRQGLRLAAVIVLKGNAVLLVLIALLGTMDPIALGHALDHLRVPEKLTHLLLLTVRYLDVLHGEYGRLRAAMKVRGFRPRMDRHSYRSFGYLAGMLLVRSLDRAERIAAAMKCRGFRGRFFMLDHFAFSPRDLPFGITAAALLLVLLLIEWRVL